MINKNNLTKQEAHALLKYVYFLEACAQNEYDTAKYFTPKVSTAFEKLRKTEDDPIER